MRTLELMWYHLFFLGGRPENDKRKNCVFCNQDSQLHCIKITNDQSGQLKNRLRTFFVLCGASFEWLCRFVIGIQERRDLEYNIQIGSYCYTFS